MPATWRARAPEAPPPSCVQSQTLLRCHPMRFCISLPASLRPSVLRSEALPGGSTTSPWTGSACAAPSSRSAPPAWKADRPRLDPHVQHEPLQHAFLKRETLGGKDAPQCLRAELACTQRKEPDPPRPHGASRGPDKNHLPNRGTEAARGQALAVLPAAVRTRACLPRAPLAGTARRSKPRRRLTAPPLPRDPPGQGSRLLWDRNLCRRGQAQPCWKGTCAALFRRRRARPT